MVTCQTCGHGYAAIFEEYDQGVGCAAEVYQRDGKYYIQGFYGSLKYDGRLYEMRSGADYKIGVICDECIDKLEDYIVKEEARYF